MAAGLGLRREEISICGSLGSFVQERGAAAAGGVGQERSVTSNN